jgi:DUF4097 and DUF4098 domain-containing protein YvlB
MTTMTGIWRGLVCAGLLAASPTGPVGAATPHEAAPLLTSAGPEQPTQAPPPPAPPSPRARAESREAHAARQAAERGSWVEAAGTIVRPFRGGDGNTLDLMNMVGDVVVVGGGKGREGTLSIVRSVQGRGPETEALLKAFEIDVAEHANRVEVRTRLPRTEGEPRTYRARVKTDYEVALPAGTALELKNMKGNVRVTNVAGDVRVEAYAGNVVAEALSRVRLLRSMSGDVTLSRSVVDGEANLQTVSGNVVASGVRASSLTLGTVSGNVQVRESSSDRALVRTVSGDIEFHGTPRRAGRYEFKTHAGDILVVTPTTSGFEFEASTFRGEVRSDLANVPTSGDGARQVRGTVGDGSAFFELTSFTGDIRVMKKAAGR